MPLSGCSEGPHSERTRASATLAISVSVPSLHEKSTHPETTVKLLISTLARLYGHSTTAGRNY